MTGLKRANLTDSRHKAFVMDIVSSGTTARSRSRAVRGRRGGLKDMPNMPIDIILEVCGHLHPQDLLHLARTSKAFRALLLDRNYAFLWRAARRHVAHLPECPSHLSEPAYANLAFSTYCHNCMKRTVKTVLWKFSARYCNSCRDTMTVTEAQLARSDAPSIMLDHAEEWLNSHRKSASMKIYHVPQITQVKGECEAAANDADVLVKFGEKQGAKVRQIHEFAAQCDVWCERMAFDRENELGELKKQRREMILSRLREEGFGNLLHDLNWRTVHHPLLSKAKPLTDHEWEKIRDEIILIIKDDFQNVRNCRIQARLNHLNGIVLNFCVRSPEMDLPTFVDVAFMPEVRRLIQGNDAASQPANWQWISTMTDSLPRLFSTWSQQTIKRLQKILSDKAGLEDLNLAVAFFECVCCGKLMHYPNVIAHECLRLRPSGGSLFSSDYYDRVAINLSNTGPWSCENLRVTNALPRILDIIRLCGKDPDWTVRERMDGMSVRLCCISPEAPHCMSVVTWRVAVEWEHEHMSKLMLDGSQILPLIWRVASDEERAMAVEQKRDHYASEEWFSRELLW